MLRDAGVRTKLLAVLAIPTLLLLVVTSLFVGTQVSAARQAGQVRALTDVAIQVNRVVHSLQQERSATLGYLQDPTTGNQAQMKGQRQFTNLQLRTLGELVAASPVDQMSSAVRAAVARSAEGHDELPSARASVDAGRFFATETDVFYSRIIRADLDLPGVVAASGTTALAQRLQAYQAVSSAIEYASHERDLVESALLRGSLTEADFAQSAALVAQQRAALADFQRNASAVTYAHLDNALVNAENSKIDRFRRSLPDLLKGRDVDYGASVEWDGAANSRIGPMTDAESGVVADIADVAESTQNSQEQRALLLVLVAVLGLGLALLLAVNLARRITRPLRRLTVAAGEIGDELPHMVERMQIPGEGPGVTVEPIPVESRDEIGRLAEAFNTVNDVTVQVAKEQAALRASIAEMFVNVARRNQVLLGRQLSQLDSMEAREEDPDVLDNLFKLDHLATRMRRNAESLLVLAGIDSTRRLRRPLPLSDVIRTAVGEIEAFDRIDLSMSEDPEVSGRHALTVAHLLAEVLENATHFSNPETRVVVSASVTGHGVDVTVTDYGLGMSEQEVAEANEKIAHPPVAEIAVSQRLGLFVVGRLAARLGASVVLRRGRSAGTVVAVSLPTAVFEGMAAPEPVDPVEVAEADLETPAADEAAADVDEPQVEDLPVEVVEEGPIVEVELVTTDDSAQAEPVAEVPAALPRRGLFRRRSRVAPEPAAEDEPDVVQPVAEVAPESEVVEPDAEVAPEPEPEPEPVAGAEPEPVAEAVAEPESEPVVPIVYAPAVDVLPSRPQRGGSRFARHRRAAPVPDPAAPPPVADPVPPAGNATHVPARVPADPDLADELLRPPAAAPAAPVPTVSAPAAAEPVRPVAAEADLTASALSELRGLYEPSFAPTSAPSPAAAGNGSTGGLARRTPKAVAGSPASAPATPPPPSRTRSAAEVRGMLSGFRAGVERGRGSAPADLPDDDTTR